MPGPLSQRLTRLLFLMTFLESVGTVLLQRGLYFYTSSVHGFSATQNLWLAFVQGVTYVLGALLSHPLAERFGERRSVLASLIALLVLHGLLTAHPTPPLIAVGFAVIGLMHAIKWPIVESYASAGRSPRALVRLIGRFNVSWALATPVALAVSGAVIDLGAERYFFLIPAVLNVAALALLWPLPARPDRLVPDAPERPNTETLARYAALLASSRWSMVASYTLLFLLAPLMPTIFARLALEVRYATLAAAFLDVFRLLAFATLGVLTAWHGRAAPLVVAGAALPVAFFMVLFGTSLPLVLLGEALFGVAGGLAYYGALYYALVVKNASVDAGGAHEGLIGLGFAVGPLAGLAGHALSDPLGGYVPAMLLAVGPVAALCVFGALRPLAKLRRA